MSTQPSPSLMYEYSWHREAVNLRVTELNCRGGGGVTNKPAAPPAAIGQMMASVLGQAVRGWAERVPSQPRHSESPGCVPFSYQVAALCVCNREGSAPLTWQDPISLFSVLSIFSQGHLAKMPPALLGKNW